MKKLITITIFIFSVANTFGSTSFWLNFIPQYYSRVVFSKENDSLRFDVLKFYVSSIRLYYKGEKTFEEQNGFHLMDSEKSLSILLNLPESTSFDEVKFNIGIDSTTSVSGALGGDLDPTKGMYWTWQSGYINFKIEGMSKNVMTRDHEFQYHLGGYAYPYNALREVSLKISNTASADVIIDLKKLIDSAEISGLSHIMSPGENAMRLATQLANCFSLK
jgi:hypothetical protein